MRIAAFVMSCARRQASLERTIASLMESGWPEQPEVILDQGSGDSALQRICSTWHRMVARAGQADSQYVLLLEDDLVFGRWFTHNLHAWPLLHDRPHEAGFYASLYNPGRPYIARYEAQNYLVADPRWVWGSQALLLSTTTARYLAHNWQNEGGNPDMRMPRLVHPITPVYYHVPSLVDHAPEPTTWGGIVHSAIDFDAEFRNARPTKPAALRQAPIGQ